MLSSNEVKSGGQKRSTQAHSRVLREIGPNGRQLTVSNLDSPEERQEVCLESHLSEESSQAEHSPTGANNKQGYTLPSGKLTVPAKFFDVECRRSGRSSPRTKESDTVS